MPHPLLLSTWSFGLRSNAPGWEILARGGSSLDAVEAVGRFAEADLTNRTVGIGGLPDASGRVSLDACVMLSPARRGGVANLRRVGHAVSVARQVMDKTRHVLLAGAEADDFALMQGFQAQDLLSEESRAAWEKWKRDHPQGAEFSPVRNIEELGLTGLDADIRGHRARAHNQVHDTIGVLAIDAAGVPAGCCTTSGMAFKMPGRVGDSPIVGHGLYVDPTVGAAVATGHGELVMGVCGAFLAVEAMRRGAAPLDAAVEVLDRMRSAYDLGREDQVGIITLRKTGEWSGASLRPGFSIAVRTADRNELVDPAKVVFEE
jgi:isoaspartyl peptidase/L-asparaginase-like protein (Ntn-hydrolase superfamily)